MKRLISLCVVGILTVGLLSIAVPVFAGNPVNPDPAFEPLTSWKGKHSDELIAAWGKPRKTKRDEKDGKVLVYRLRFYGERIVGETKTSWSDAGIGPTTGHVSGRHESATNSEPGLVFAGNLEVIATQKVKFYVDRRGIIQRQEYAPRKWKKKKP